MPEKIVNEYVYDGLGFPIRLLNVPMIKVMGVWTPNIDYNKLQKMILWILVHKPTPLTGNEVRFIRQYFEMSMEAFGKLFGISHVAISKWEKKDNHATHADLNTERLIRLLILEKLQVNNKEFRKVFREVLLDASLGEKQRDTTPLVLDVEKGELFAA